MEEEIWLDVKDFPDYKISNFGNVKSFKRGEKLLSPNPHKYPNGIYYSICLYNDGKRHDRKLHRLVASTFIPNPENKPCIDHLNRNPSDNHVSNLRWVTALENNQNRISMDNATYIHYHKKQKKYQVYRPSPNRGYIGEYVTYEEALEARKISLGF